MVISQYCCGFMSSFVHSFTRVELLFLLKTNTVTTYATSLTVAETQLDFTWLFICIYSVFLPMRFQWFYFICRLCFDSLLATFQHRVGPFTCRLLSFLETRMFLHSENIQVEFSILQGFRFLDFSYLLDKDICLPAREVKMSPQGHRGIPCSKLGSYSRDDMIEFVFHFQHRETAEGLN